MRFRRVIPPLLLSLLTTSDFALPADNTDAGPQAATDPAGIEFFEKNVRPVLVDHCYTCHSAKAIKLKGQLRLDSQQGIARGGEGGAVIVSGKPGESRLIKAIRWTDPNFQMPPKEKL